jgi:hypothetical protein
MGDEAGSVELIAAALRADAADVTTLIRVLANTLGDTLPAGMVEVRRSRTLSDRIRGRGGSPVAVDVNAPETRLSLEVDPRSGVGARAEVRRVVRGVVISRQELSVDEWVSALAAVVSDLAERNADARAALDRLLHG